MPTKAELEAEVARLTDDNAKMRYVVQCLLDAGRAERESAAHMAKASQHLLDALSHLTYPSIPNN